MQNSTNPQQFRWDEQRTQVAVSLASGATKQEAADEAGVDRTTIYNWLKHPAFAEEIDRLSLMVDAASRAERLRLAMRVLKSKMKDGILESDRDALDWLKYIQSETDGVKLDLSKLALDHASDGRHDRQQLPERGAATTSITQIQTPVAHTGPDTGDRAGETTPATDLTGEDCSAQ